MLGFQGVDQGPRRIKGSVDRHAGFYGKAADQEAVLQVVVSGWDVDDQVDRFCQDQVKDGVLLVIDPVDQAGRDAMTLQEVG